MPIWAVEDVILPFTTLISPSVTLIKSEVVVKAEPVISIEPVIWFGLAFPLRISLPLYVSAITVVAVVANPSAPITALKSTSFTPNPYPWLFEVLNWNKPCDIVLVSVVPGNVISVPVPLLIVKGLSVLVWVKVKGPSIVADH